MEISERPAWIGCEQDGVEVWCRGIEASPKARTQRTPDAARLPFQNVPQPSRIAPRPTRLGKGHRTSSTFELSLAINELKTRFGTEIMRQTDTSSLNPVAAPIAQPEPGPGGAATAGFRFDVWLQGTGRTEEEAWDHANEAFFLEPGDPASCERLDTCPRDPEDPRWPASRLARDDLCCTAVDAARRFVFLFRVHLFGIGTSEEEAWAAITEELQTSPAGSELARLEEVTLMHAAEADAAQLDLFACDT
jgi:hypothetical protein